MLCGTISFRIMSVNYFGICNFHLKQRQIAARCALLSNATRSGAMALQKTSPCIAAMQFDPDRVGLKLSTDSLLGSDCLQLVCLASGCLQIFFGG